MTNHLKDAHISDSASGGTEETMPSEIREEKKVREKLVEIIRRSHVFNNLASGGLEADAILQSPDLRVTLKDAEYTVHKCYERCPGEYKCERPPTMVVVIFDSLGRTVGRFHELKQAQEYADFLNSKEPK